MRSLAILLFKYSLLAAVPSLVGCADNPSPGKDFEGPIEEFFVEPKGEPAGLQRHGKVIALDPVNRTLDAVHDELPVEIRARRREEVGTIALISCETRLSGRYIGIGGAYAHDCTATIVDASSQALMGYTGAQNTPPRKVIFGFFPHTASRPTGQIAAAIAKLPEPNTQ
jgi:hypothetical protein